MVSSLEKNLSTFNATQKDVLGSGFGVLERNVQKLSRGNHLVNVVLEYDFGIDGAIAASSGTVSLREEGSSTAFTLPASCQVTRADYKVSTTFTSAADAAILSIGIPTDDAAGIFAALAISSGTTWDATSKVIVCIQTGTTATYGEMTTAERNIIITNSHASEATTAGKIKLYLSYIEVD